MFDFDIGKMLVVAIVALAVIPPKDLPRVMRIIGQTMGRMRRMASEFQGQFMDAMREAEFESVRKELADLNQKATDSIAEMNQTAASSAFDPANMIRDEVTKAAAEPIAHLPSASGEGADIGSSEVALATQDARTAESSLPERPLLESGRPARPDGAE